MGWQSRAWEGLRAEVRMLLCALIRNGEQELQPLLRNICSPPWGGVHTAPLIWLFIWWGLVFPLLSPTGMNGSTPKGFGLLWGRWGQSSSLCRNSTQETDSKCFGISLKPPRSQSSTSREDRTWKVTGKNFEELLESWESHWELAGFILLWNQYCPGYGCAGSAKGFLRHWEFWSLSNPSWQGLPCTPGPLEGRKITQECYKTNIQPPQEHTPGYCPNWVELAEEDQHLLPQQRNQIFPIWMIYSAALPIWHLW